MLDQKNTTSVLKTANLESNFNFPFKEISAKNKNSIFSHPFSFSRIYSSDLNDIQVMKGKIESLEREVFQNRKLIREKDSFITVLQQQMQLLRRKKGELEVKLQNNAIVYEQKIRQLSSDISTGCGTKVTQKKFKENWINFEEIMKLIQSSSEQFPDLFQSCQQTFSQYETKLINFMTASLESFALTLIDQIGKEEQKKLTVLGRLHEYRDSLERCLEEEEKRDQEGNFFVLNQQETASVLNPVIVRIDLQKNQLNDLQSLKSSIKRRTRFESNGMRERTRDREEDKFEQIAEVNISKDQPLQ